MSTASEAFSDRLAKYGLKKPGLSLHSLRHTHATILISRGVNIKLVSKRLGHAKPSITLDIYAHVMRDDQELAVQAMDQFFNDAAIAL
jgi:integrase